MAEIKWIPVTDSEKPSDHERVLISCSWEDGTSEVYLEEWYQNAFGNEYGFGLWNKRVKAWARLPEPYKT